MNDKGCYILSEDRRGSFLRHGGGGGGGVGYTLRGPLTFVGKN